ncbi:TPR-like protein [Dioscorea alata]|uniref:TPR-like protein n=1 Tax=Dioscorea alata TaxID=55571 RepID=A0ACB7WA60_DIOAL|nr:TPR-like protein [Dioscorea alata]
MEIMKSSLKLLASCASLRALKQIHAHMFLNGLHDDNYVAVQLLSFCSRELREVGYARMIFNSLAHSANVFLWTAMITSYSNHQTGTMKEAFTIYKLMQQQGPSPNKFTLSSVLKACSSLQAVAEGNQIHAHAFKLGFLSSIYVQTALLDMYAKHGQVQKARNIFDLSGENVVACNAMISCYTKVRDMIAAREIFDKMSHKDGISWSVMISGYAGSGNMLAARELFHLMSERGINSWNALVAGYTHNGEWYEAFKLFSFMCLECVKPNPATMTILMSACGQLGALKLAWQLHGYLWKHCIEKNVHVHNSLIDMYAKCGSLLEAHKVFSEMPIKDVVSFNVMIGGFANYGHGENALELFSEMLEGGIQPDTFTFLGILSACCHSRLVDSGAKFFSCMKRDFGIEPSVDHCACMVDLFGRAGYVEEAYDFVKAMHVAPHAGVWGALLNACRTYCDVKIGEIAAHELFRIEPWNPGNYVILSNIYARAHCWASVTKIRCFMRGRIVEKTSGSSWIQVNHEFHKFTMGEALHPQNEEIYGVLKNIYLQFL